MDEATLPADLANETREQIAENKAIARAWEEGERGLLIAAAMESASRRSQRLSARLAEYHIAPTEEA